jgi:hypothetical protein
LLGTVGKSFAGAAGLANPVLAINPLRTSKEPAAYSYIASTVTVPPGCASATAAGFPLMEATNSSKQSEFSERDKLVLCGLAADEKE